jgi:hypothetical protein
LGCFACGAAFGDGGYCELCFTFVDFIRIEGFAIAAVVPLGEVLVFGMFGIGDGIEESLEAGRAL